MGAGASADSARQLALQNLLNKPADISDITTLDQAKEELKTLRLRAREFQQSMVEREHYAASVAKEGAGGGGKQRLAVKDFKAKFKGGDDWKPVVVAKDDATRQMLTAVISSNILFHSCTPEEQKAIVDAFDQVNVTKDTNVIKRGDPGDFFYVCDTGIMDIYVFIDGNMEKLHGSHIAHGQSFGELALMYNQPRAATLTAHTDATLWRIHRDTFKEITIHFKHVRTQKNIALIKNVVLHGKHLGDILRPDQLEQLAMTFEREVFSDGEIIIREGAPGDHFYVVESGLVSVLKEDAASGEDKEVSKVGPGQDVQWFGERALLSQEMRAATCVAIGTTSCLSLGRDDFIALMGTVDDFTSTDHKGASADNAAGSKSQLVDMQLSDLVLTKTLGMGAFGSVKLCQHKPTGQYYALKCQSKAMIEENELEDHVLNELKIMAQFTDPFIVKLYAAMQDDRYLYFCMELLQGGELYAYMQGKGSLTERDARFYAASVTLALNSMHEIKIAYRDIKPENIVFDERGYVKLVDLGLAKHIPAGKTWTICGTPDYIAPEIILHEGHNHAVDCWAIGILIYEMMTGTTPFADSDAMKVYQNILKHDIKIPNSFSKDVADLVKKLLHAQQSKRFGTLKGGLSAVMKHKWMASFNFADLIAGKTKAPYVPKISSKHDTSNFADFDDIPEPVSWSPSLPLSLAPPVSLPRTLAHALVPLSFLFLSFTQAVSKWSPSLEISSF